MNFTTTINHTLITNNENMKEKDKEKDIKRKALYKRFNCTKYHNILEQMYCDMKSRIKYYRHTHNIYSLSFYSLFRTFINPLC